MEADLKVYIYMWNIRIFCVCVCNVIIIFGKMEISRDELT